MRPLRLVALLLGMGWQGAIAWAGLPPEDVPPEEDLLVLEVRLGDYSLGDGILAYRFTDPTGGAVEPSALLPAGEIARLLELPLDIDLTHGTVRGPWIEELAQSDPAANPPSPRAALREAAAPGEVVALHQDLFVESELLSHWLGIDFALDFATLVLRLDPRLETPLQRRLEREARWGAFAARSAAHTLGPRFPPRVIPYRRLDWPVVDARLDLSAQRFADRSTDSRAHYSLVAQGDLLGMTSDLFLGGRTTAANDDLLADLRWNLGRHDPKAGLMGLLKATDVRLGDLVSPHDPLVSRGRPGRGFELARVSPQVGGAGPVEFDRTTVQGEGLPGWDVELYRNDVLYDVTTIGADGRYAFHDVPLFFGRNRLRRVFYGPRGERRESLEEVTLTTDLLRPRELTYHFGVYQQDVGLFRRSRSLAASDTAVQGATRLVAGMAQGLGRRLSYDAGFSSIPLADGRRDYLRVGLRAAILGTAGRLSWVRDLSGGSAATLAFQRYLGRFTLTGEHTRFDDFVGEDLELATLLSRSEVRLDGQVRLFGPHVLPVGLTLRRERRPEGSRWELRGSTGWSVSLGRFRWTHRWQFDAAGSDLETGDLALRGHLLVNSWVRDLALRGSVRYELLPSTELSSLDLVGRWRRGRRLGATFGLDHSLSRGVTHLSAGAEWELETHSVGFDLGWGSDGSLRASVSLSTSLARDPRSGRARWRAEPGARRGEVSARAFLDHDGDGRFGAGDKPLEGIRFAIDGSESEPSGPDGVAQLPLCAGRHADLTVDETSLEDPFWVPRVEGLGFVPRPGTRWTAEFPIAVAGEIDGTVTLRTERGERVASGVRLQLIDSGGDVVQEVASQFDGFYLFQRVLPGTYTLRIDPQQSQWKLNPLPGPEVRLGGGEVRTLDLGVEPTTADRPTSRKQLPPG